MEKFVQNVEIFIDIRYNSIISESVTETICSKGISCVLKEEMLCVEF